ncbi:hypothetical protein ERJ75_000712400 [Trypanosoma vivax]|nr:hypothetical protein ERJ75_000712400 [Trypanosoma vivax]
MLTGVQFHVELEDELPISIVRKGDDTIAVVRDNQLNSLFLPFSLRACVIQRVENCSELHTVRENGALEIVSREWCNRVKLRVGLTTSQVRTHWLLLKTEGMSVATHCFEGTEEGVRDVVIWLESTLLDSSYEIWLVSEPQVCCESVSQEVGTMRCVDENEFPNERVVFGDSVADVALYIEDFLRSFFIHGSTLPTAVFWPSQLTFPVNVHCSNNELRVLEHRALLLPVRPLLLTSMRIKDWSTAKGLNRAPVNGVPRNNQHGKST